MAITTTSFTSVGYDFRTFLGRCQSEQCQSETRTDFTPPDTQKGCFLLVPTRFLPPYLWIGTNIWGFGFFCLFFGVEKSITRANLKMEIPASKGNERRKIQPTYMVNDNRICNQQLLLGILSIHFDKDFHSFDLSSKVRFGLEKRSFAEFGFGLFLHLRG